MSGRLARVRAVFVEQSVAPAPAPAAAFARILDAAPPLALPGPGALRSAPTVVVLCAPPRSAAAVAAVALSLARLLGTRCGIAAVLGASGRRPGVATPTARRMAARLRTRAEEASVAGRLVWLADRRAAAADVVARDPVSAAAAMSADLGRAATVGGMPGVLALPLSRTAGLDRVLAWHEGIVVVREPGACDVVTAHVLESLAALGQPVACMSPPTRHAAMLAQAGLHAPSEVVRAVAQLDLGASHRAGAE